MSKKVVAFLLIVYTVFSVGSCGKDYRKVLEGRGIPFTREAFLKEVGAGNKENVVLFLKAGMDVNAVDKEGSTALMIAAEKGDIELARVLLQNGADVNARNRDGYTALMYAAYKGSAEVVELLLENNADVNARDKDGWTALRYAVLQGRNDIVKLLAKAKERK